MLSGAAPAARIVEFFIDDDWVMGVRDSPIRHATSQLGTSAPLTNPCILAITLGAAIACGPHSRSHDAFTFSVKTTPDINRAPVILIPEDTRNGDNHSRNDDVISRGFF